MGKGQAQSRTSRKEDVEKGNEMSLQVGDADEVGRAANSWSTMVIGDEDDCGSQSREQADG